MNATASDSPRVRENTNVWEILHTPPAHWSYQGMQSYFLYYDFLQK